MLFKNLSLLILSLFIIAACGGGGGNVNTGGNSPSAPTGAVSGQVELVETT